LLDGKETRDNKRLIGYAIVIEANDKVPSFHGNNVASEPFATIANGDKVTDERNIYHTNIIHPEAEEVCTLDYTSSLPSTMGLPCVIREVMA
jgi:hypothetical protein